MFGRPGSCSSVVSWSSGELRVGILDPEVVCLAAHASLPLSRRKPRSCRGSVTRRWSAATRTAVTQAAAATVAALGCLAVLAAAQAASRVPQKPSHPRHRYAEGYLILGGFQVVIFILLHCKDFIYKSLTCMACKFVVETTTLYTKGIVFSGALLFVMEVNCSRLIDEKKVFTARQYRNTKVEVAVTQIFSSFLIALACFSLFASQVFGGYWKGS